ncbi:MAG: FkbM family methyltransferase [Bacteroidota bacterium]
MLKNAIKKIVDPRSKSYLYLYHYWFKPARFPSVDHLVDRFANLEDEVFFMQVGTNDGATSDPFFRHIRLNGWRGILIEPLEQEFQQLQNNHKNNPQLIFENVAISNREETKPFYSIDNSKGELPFWVNKLSSFDPQIPQEVCDLYEQAVMISKEVHCTTINALLDKHGVAQLDLLLTDTEGYDAEILKTIDFERVRPKMLIYEHRHLSPADYELTLNLLRPLGYHLFKDEYDTVAFQSEILREEYAAHLI